MQTSRMNQNQNQSAKEGQKIKNHADGVRQPSPDVMQPRLKGFGSVLFLVSRKEEESFGGSPWVKRG